jgi:tRNA(Arg) A34 adenosine deaminase TadA
MHSKYMRLAIEAAQQGIQQGQTPFGACIVKQGKILACAHNQVWQDQDITAHAEITALRQACRALRGIDLSGAVLYSTCEPCPMCFSAAHWARIKTIVYGASISDAAKAGFNELRISNQRLKTAGGLHLTLIPGVLREECGGLFALWQEQNKSRIY